MGRVDWSADGISQGLIIEDLVQDFIGLKAIDVGPIDSMDWGELCISVEAIATSLPRLKDVRLTFDVLQVLSHADAKYHSLEPLEAWKVASNIERLTLRVRKPAYASLMRSWEQHGNAVSNLLGTL